VMNDMTETFYELEQTLMHYRKKDFEQLLAEDFQEFGTSGMRYNKETQLSFINETGISEIPFKIMDFQVHLLAPNLAHVTYQTESIEHGTKSLRSSIWRFENACWQMYFHQGTRIA
jgi:hypothetical protein